MPGRPTTFVDHTQQTEPKSLLSGPLQKVRWTMTYSNITDCSSHSTISIMQETHNELNGPRQPLREIIYLRIIWVKSKMIHNMEIVN